MPNGEKTTCLDQSNMFDATLTTEYECILWFHDSPLWLEGGKTYDGMQAPS